MPHELSEDAFQKSILASLGTHDEDRLNYTVRLRYEVDYDPDAPAAANRTIYNRHHALLPAEFPAFVAANQPEAWRRLQSDHGNEAARYLSDILRHALDARGCLDVLRRGVTVDGVDLAVVRFPPTDDRPDDIAWRANRFVVIEELEYDPDQPEGHRNRLDLVLFLNGIPLVTVELKNLGTGQTVGNAIEQYEATRNPSAPVFRFPYRSVVHFVIDQRRAMMTTRLRAAKTIWFPFDEYLQEDAVAQDESHPRTAFLWNTLWRPRSLLQLVRDFAVLQEPDPAPAGTPAKHPLQDAALIFPRVHQRRAVLMLLVAMSHDGPGRRYLVQHSTGSGKSFSIGWLAMMATRLYRAGAKAFDKVLVVSDRRIIHRQLSDLVRSLTPASVEIEHYVASVDGGSRSLIEAICGSQEIIVSTVHAFFHARNSIAQQSGKRYCVIIDEAHRSQDGSLNAAMRSVLDELGTGEAGNLSMVAFTATPTDLTLQRFGTEVAENNYRPHDSYTMRQARREGFIVNVLQNYVQWKQQATATAEARAELLIRHGGPTLNDILAEDEEMIRLKATVIARHFVDTVKRQLGDQARAMVVTTSKKAALNYRSALLAALEASGDGDLGVLIAFTGNHTVETNGTQESVTEGSLNGADAEGRPIQDERIAVALRKTHRILIAVDKFQTGFDEPKLLAMYVDKSLRGINAVQTLSRLNRPFPGKGRQLRSSDPPPVFPFVVDFFGNVDGVLDAFKKYDIEALPETFLPGDLLVRVGEKIRAMGTYTDEILDDVWNLWQGKAQQADSVAFHAYLNHVLDNFYAIGSDDDRMAYRHLIRRFLYYWCAAHEVVTRELDAAQVTSLYKQALLYAKLLPTLDDWSPETGDDQPPQRLRADHITFDDRDLQYLTTVALLPTGDDYVDPREITVGTPKQRRYKTLQEVVAAFNAHSSTPHPAADPGTLDRIVPLQIAPHSQFGNELADELELAVVAATASVGHGGIIDLQEFRRALGPTLRRAIRDAPGIHRPVKQFLFSEKDRFGALVDGIVDDSYELLQREA